MPSDSSQHKLSRVRPPRVQITYDVEIGDAQQKKELPFVVGVLADLAGRPAAAPAPLKQRKFVEIDRDNFDQVMAGIAPRLALQVRDRLGGDGATNVELQFASMDDFDPGQLVNQVASLRRLVDARRHLSDLLTKLDGNDDLDRLLRELAQNRDGLSQLKLPAGEAAPAPADGAAPGADGAAPDAPAA